MFEVESEQWWCVRSVSTDGAGHSIVETDVMPESALWSTVADESFMWGLPVQGGVGGFHRWTWSSPGWLCRRSEMIIANKIQ